LAILLLLALLVWRPLNYDIGIEKFAGLGDYYYAGYEFGLLVEALSGPEPPVHRTHTSIIWPSRR
jgi:hypothetical protein